MVGEVALVFGGGEAPGRAVALALAARGVRVVVSGRDERAIARVVGEVTCGGGAARHLAGEMTDEDHVDAALRKTAESFARPAFVIVAAPTAVCARVVADRAVRYLADRGRLVVVVNSTSAAKGAGDVAGHSELAAFVSRMAALPTEKGTTCNAVEWAGGTNDDGEDAAEAVMFLCSAAADGITGQVLASTAASVRSSTPFSA